MNPYYKPYWLQSNELEHYGILGMRWGIRRYQPYPKGYKGGIYLGVKDGSAPLQYKSLLLNRAYTRVRDVLSKPYSDINYKNGPIEKLSELSKKTKPTTVDEDLKVVNAGFNKDPTINCLYSAISMELRRRGYDVIARQSDRGVSQGKVRAWFNGLNTSDIKQIKINRKPMQSIKSWVKEGYDKVCSDLEQYEDGARGYIETRMRGDRDSASRHVINWIIQDGEVTFYDAQRALKNPGDVFSYSTQEYTYARLDNLELNEKVTEVCMSRDYKEKYAKKEKGM